MNKILTFLIVIIQSISAVAISPELKDILSRNKYLLQGNKLSAADLEDKVIFIDSAYSRRPSFKSTTPYLQVVQGKLRNTKENIAISVVRYKSGDKKKLLFIVESMKVDKQHIYMHFLSDDLGVRVEKNWGFHGPWYFVIISKSTIAIHTPNGITSAKTLSGDLYKHDLFPELFTKNNMSITEKVIMGKPVKTTMILSRNLVKIDGEMAEEAKTILQAFDLWDKKEKVQSINKTSLVNDLFKMDVFCKIFAGMKQFKLFAHDLDTLKKNKQLMGKVNYYRQIQTSSHELDNSAIKRRRVKPLLSSLENFIDAKKPTVLLKRDLEKMNQDQESL